MGVDASICIRREVETLRGCVGAWKGGRTGGDGCNRLVQLEFVQNGCFEVLSVSYTDNKINQTGHTRLASCVQSQHQQPHLLIPKNLSCLARV